MKSLMNHDTPLEAMKITFSWTRISRGEKKRFRLVFLAIFCFSDEMPHAWSISYGDCECVSNMFEKRKGEEHKNPGHDMMHFVHQHIRIHQSDQTRPPKHSSRTNKPRHEEK